MTIRDFLIFRKFRRSFADDFGPVLNREDSPTGDVTIIINVWKRDYLDAQLTCLLNQTVRPKNIWIVHFEDHIQITDVIKKHRNHFPEISIIHSDLNLKYFGRFSVAINVTTKYVWLIDDDVLPGTKWLEKCITKCEELNSIITCTGRIIPKNNFRPEKRTSEGYKNIYYGDESDGKEKNFLSEDIRVDYACNSYFLKTEWLRAFWKIWPTTFLSGEDIHLCASCKSVLDVNTYALQQLSDEDTGNLRRQLGWDKHASWKKDNFLDIRESVLKYHINEHGWQPLRWD